MTQKENQERKISSKTFFEIIKKAEDQFIIKQKDIVENVMKTKSKVQEK